MEEDKKGKVLEISTRLENLLPLIDMFAIEMKDNIELLEEAKQSLRENISYKTSAMPVIMAMGGQYDSTEDRLKLKTLECLIELIKIRNDYAKEVKQMRERKKNNADMLQQLFGILN